LGACNYGISKLGPWSELQHLSTYAGALISEFARAASYKARADFVMFGNFSFFLADSKLSYSCFQLAPHLFFLIHLPLSWKTSSFWISHYLIQWEIFALAAAIWSVWKQCSGN